MDNHRATTVFRKHKNKAVKFLADSFTTRNSYSRNWETKISFLCQRLVALINLISYAHEDGLRRYAYSISELYITSVSHLAISVHKEKLRKNWKKNFDLETKATYSAMSMSNLPARPRSSLLLQIKRHCKVN